MGTVVTLTSPYNLPLLTSVDVVPLMKTAGVVENSGQYLYSIGVIVFEIALRCFILCFIYYNPICGISHII